MKRSVLVFVVGLYLGAGLFNGLLMKQAIPALNTVGIAVITITWPKTIYCARTSRGCDPMPPEWMAPAMFSF